MKWKNNKGFSLAEMLIVVAIIIILMGVAFIAVQNHQRSMTRLEFDGIAKEIFIAAQNHLTSAEGQGYLQFTAKQKDDTAEKEAERIGLKEDSSSGTEDVRYFVYNAVHTYAPREKPPKSILDLMLPFGAVDETILAGGRYIIRYQPSSGTVLDVFYSFPGKSSMLTISGKTLDSSDYPTLMGDEINYREGGERNREQYPGGVVGWYGNVEPLPIGERIDAPELIIHNEEILWVEIRSSAKNDLNGTSLNLIVKGDVSGTQIAFDLKSMSDLRVKQLNDSADGSKVYAVILDDITTSQMHFSDLYIVQNGTRKEFNPGENISVEAVAFTNNALTNIGYSGKKTTNSAFADIEAVTVNNNTTYSTLIENFRHFENLDKTISSFDREKAYKDKNDTAVTIGAARQISDMNWNDDADDKAFIKRIHTLRKDFKYDTTDVTIYSSDNNAVTTTVDTLYPVSPDYPLVYDGQNNAVSNVNVKVEHNGDSGLFGTLTSGSEVKNLELIDFDITGTTSAGALAGAVTNTTITNVVAHNSEAKDSTFYNSGDSAKPNVTATGAAGGLIGSMSGGSVTKSAAAVYVKGGTDAGGLIGSAVSGTVTACYSGGHTYSGAPAYDSAADRPDPRNSKNTYPVRYYGADNKPMYNVTATGGTAGGLIGSAGAATISNSYSTCSASGTTAGGFVGSSTGRITDCYCTGLVMKPEDSVANHGAFAGSAVMSNLSNCQFFEIINEIKRDEDNNEISGYDYLRPLGNVSRKDTDESSVFALDSVSAMSNEKAAYNYNLARDELKDAVPYDAGGTDTFGLKVYYKKTNGKTGYNLQTVEQLSGGDGSLKTSEGDTTDYFVSTHYGDWPAPEEFIFN